MTVIIDRKNSDAFYRRPQILARDQMVAPCGRSSNAPLGSIPFIATHLWKMYVPGASLIGGYPLSGVPSPGGGPRSAVERSASQAIHSGHHEPSLGVASSNEEAGEAPDLPGMRIRKGARVHSVGLARMDLANRAPWRDVITLGRHCEDRDALNSAFPDADGRPRASAMWEDGS